MKERPVLFTPENAQKVFDGSKSQTRRIMKPQPPTWVKEFGYTCFTPKGSISGRGTYEDQGPGEKFFKCPYGAPGDRLWVRESFSDCAQCGRIIFKAQHQTHCPGCDESSTGLKWNPSIHLPRWACRTVLEITEIRVERLKDISQADAIAEGAPPSHTSIDRVSREYGYADFTRSWYAQLWDSINGPGSWDANPWVWAITFRKVPQ